MVTSDTSAWPPRRCSAVTAPRKAVEEMARAAGARASTPRRQGPSKVQPDSWTRTPESRATPTPSLTLASNRHAVACSVPPSTSRRAPRRWPLKCTCVSRSAPVPRSPSVPPWMSSRSSATVPRASTTVKPLGAVRTAALPPTSWVPSVAMKGPEYRPGARWTRRLGAGTTRASCRRRRGRARLPSPPGATLASTQSSRAGAPAEGAGTSASPCVRGLLQDCASKKRLAPSERPPPPPASTPGAHS